MKFCVVQLGALKGDIAGNIRRHCHWIAAAAERDAGAIFFPELSLTGYEPTMAADLAQHWQSDAFTELQLAADRNGLFVGAGAPTDSPDGIHISMLLFSPQASRRIYSKYYLHADEKPFFTAGNGVEPQCFGNTKVGLAICYELSVPEHARIVLDGAAAIYVASVAKTPSGTDAAHIRLAEIAREYRVPVMMANCTGTADGERCGGRSAVWDGEGDLLTELGDSGEGAILFDLAAGTATKFSSV